MSAITVEGQPKRGRPSHRHTLRFPSDRPYGRLLLRDREQVARDLPEWRRMWRRFRIGMDRRLRYLGLPRDVRIGWLRSEERWFWGEYEEATWQRERVARGVVAVRDTEDVWLQVTDEARDLRPLAVLRPASLWGLSLDYPVDDAALAHVVGLGALRRLYLAYDNMITDASLARLAALPLLTDMSLSSPNLTDAGLVHLRRLTRLRSLYLHGPRVSVAALARACRTLELEELSIDLREPLSDADVPSLCALPASLRHLDAACRNLSEAGAVRIEAALPRCDLDLRWLDAPAPPDRPCDDDSHLIDPWSIQLPPRPVRTKPGRARDLWHDAQQTVLCGSLIPVRPADRRG